MLRNLSGKTGAHGVRDVIEGDDLHLAPAECEQLHERQGCDHPQQGRAAIGVGADHEAGLQDGPVEIAPSQGVVGLALGPQEGGRRGGVGPGRGYLDEGANPARLAGRDQRRNGVLLACREPVACAVLQGAGSVHDRVNAFEIGSPGCFIGQRRQIGPRPGEVGREPPAQVEVTAEADDVVSRLLKATCDGQTDEAIGA